MSSRNIALLLLILTIVAISAFSFFRQRRLIRRLKQLASSVEASKNELIAQQQRNSQLKQEMTNNIAHELKTPVASIRGYLEILLSGKPIDDSKRQLFLERCYSQTLRLSDLVNDVALINSIEESSALYPKESLNIADIVRAVIQELEEKCLYHNIIVHNSLPDSMIIIGNKILIYSVFRNLLDNVIAYAGNNVEVGIECYKQDDQRFFIRFFDTGVGVDNIWLPKLFDRFLRVDKGRSRKNGGTGLGLSIVKHAVLFHGGDIYVQNRNGGGLEFFFSFDKIGK